MLVRAWGAYRREQVLKRAHDKREEEYLMAERMAGMVKDIITTRDAVVDPDQINPQIQRNAGEAWLWDLQRQRKEIDEKRKEIDEKIDRIQHVAAGEKPVLKTTWKKGKTL